MPEGPSGPSFDTMLQHRLSQAQGQGGTGSSPLLLGMRLDTNVGTVFDIKKLALLPADSTLKIAGQKAPGPIAKLLADMGLKGPEILEGMKKVAQAGPVREANIAEITGNNNGLGGGMTVMASRSGGDDGQGIA